MAQKKQVPFSVRPEKAPEKAAYKASDNNEGTQAKPGMRRNDPARRGKSFMKPRRKGPEYDGERRPEENTDNLLPGVKPVLELLRSQPERVDQVHILKGRRDKLTDEIIDICREKSILFKLVESQTLEKIYPGRSQGVLARLFDAGFMDFDDLLLVAPTCALPLILALDQVVDPGNAGTLARTLYALGGAGMVVPRHQGAYMGAAASKAAAGALQKLPVSKVSNLSQALDKAEAAGFAIYGAGLGEQSESVYSFTPQFPAVLVLGSEEAGLRQGVARRCSNLLKVPMREDFDSINVAQAGAIIMGFLSAAVR